MSAKQKYRSRQRFWLAIAIIIAMVDFFIRMEFPHSSILPDRMDIVMFLLAVGAAYMSICEKKEK
jgi:hypothetical protein